MPINVTDRKSLDDYLEQQKKEQEVKLDSNVAELLEKAPLTTAQLSHEYQKAQVSSNYSTMQAIAGNVNELDSQEEAAHARYATALQNLHNRMEKFDVAGINTNEIEKAAEDAEEGETNIIFKILDAFGKPMYAMEGAFIGAMARNDDLYEGMNMFERTLAGIEDGWTGAEDEEGNRIVNDAAVVGSLIYGDHDVSDWNMLSRITAGLGAMFIFGKFDPLMLGFSMLGKTDHSITSTMRAMQDKGVLPQIFNKRILNTAEGETAIVDFIREEGKSLEANMTASIRTLSDKYGITATEVMNGEKSVNMSEYAKELKKLWQDQINRRDINTKHSAAVMKIRNMIMDETEAALMEGDVEVLRDLKTFDVLKSYFQEDLTEQQAIRKFKDFMLIGGVNKKELLTQIHGEVWARFNSALLGENGFQLTMNDVLKDIVGLGDGAATVLSKGQINNLISMMLKQGFWTPEALIQKIDEELVTLTGSVNDGKKAAKAEKKAAKAGKSAEAVTEEVEESEDIIGELKPDERKFTPARTELERLENLDKLASKYGDIIEDWLDMMLYEDAPVWTENFKELLDNNGLRTVEELREFAKTAELSDNDSLLVDAVKMFEKYLDQAGVTLKEFIEGADNHYLLRQEIERISSNPEEFDRILDDAIPRLLDDKSAEEVVKIDKTLSEVEEHVNGIEKYLDPVAEGEVARTFEDYVDIIETQLTKVDDVARVTKTEIDDVEKLMTELKSAKFNDTNLAELFSPFIEGGLDFETLRYLFNDITEFENRLNKLQKEVDVIKPDVVKGPKLEKEAPKLETPEKSEKPNVSKKDAYESLDKKQKRRYDELSQARALLTGNKTITKNDSDFQELLDVIHHNNDMIHTTEKEIKRLEKSIENLENKSLHIKGNLMKEGKGSFVKEGERLYDAYKEEKQQLDYWQSVISGQHHTEMPYTVKMHERINQFFQKTPSNPTDREAFGKLRDLPKEDFEAWAMNLKETKPEVYATLDELKVLNRNKDLKFFGQKKFSKDAPRITKEELTAAKTSGNKAIHEDAATTVLHARAKSALKQIENLVENYNAMEKGITAKLAEANLLKFKKRTTRVKNSLTKYFEKFETEFSDEIKLALVGDMRELKTNNKLIEFTKKELQKNKTKLSNRKRDKANLKKSRNNLKKAMKSDTGKVAAESSGESKLLTRDQALESHVGIEILKRGILNTFFNIENTRDFVTESDNVINQLGLYKFKANERHANGREWLKQLRDFVTQGDAYDFAELPLFNQRMATGLSEAISIGTSTSFTSEKLSGIVDNLRNMQSRIFSEVVKSAFSSLPGGSDMAQELMVAMTRHTNAITGELMDEGIQYQKKLLNMNRENLDQVASMNKELMGKSNNIKGLNSEGLKSLSESGYRGGVGDINQIIGEHYGKLNAANYNKYDFAQKLFFDDPFATSMQVAQDAQLLGDFGSTLIHAAESGAFFSGQTAPAKLVKEGRLVGMSAGEFRDALTTMMKLEAESNMDRLMKTHRVESSKLKAAGINAESPSAFASNMETQLDGTLSRAQRYFDGFMNKYFEDVKDLADDEALIYVPKELQKLLAPPKVSNKQLSGIFAFTDSVLNAWKKITLFSPGFNFKNIFGNYASMYIVDPAGMTADAMSRGMALYQRIPEMANTIEKVSADFLSQNPGKQFNSIDLDEMMVEHLKANKDMYKDLAMPEYGIDPVDMFHLYKEAEAIRVVDPAIEDIVGRQKNIGNLTKANTPRDISEAMRATHATMELAQTDPRLASALTGMGFDLTKPSNIVTDIIDGNLAFSHHMTSSIKMHQLLNNKGYEEAWLKAFLGVKDDTKWGVGKIEDELAKLSPQKREAWEIFRDKEYKREFGYANSRTMIQDMFFDPGALTDSERNIASRLVPFWGFFKKSMELSLNRINNFKFEGFYGIQRFLEHFRTMQGLDYADLSEFSRNEQYLAFKTGEDKILNVKWGNPTQTLNNLIVRDKNIISELFGNANPMIKFIVSEAANREDLFFGGKYDTLSDEIFGTLAPGAVRNVQRQVKYQLGKDELSPEQRKGILAEMAPTIFSNENISDNRAEAYNAAALEVEKALNQLLYDEDYQISLNSFEPELPAYQEFVLDLF